MPQFFMPLLEKALTDCGNTEPSGALSGEIDTVKIGMVLTSYLWAPDNNPYRNWVLFA